MDNTLKFKYNLSRISTDEKYNNKFVDIIIPIPTDDNQLMEDGLTSEQKIFDVIGSVNADGEKGSELTLSLNEMFSIDTCLAIEKSVRNGYDESQEENSLIGDELIYVREYIVDNILILKNIYSSQIEEENDEQREVNQLVTKIILKHKEAWNRLKVRNIEEYEELAEKARQKESLKELVEKINLLDEYPGKIENKNGYRGAPYYLYEQISAIADVKYKERRRTVAFLNSVNMVGEGLRNSDMQLFSCLALNTNEYERYIGDVENKIKDDVVKNVNACYSGGLSSSEKESVENIRDYISQNFSGKKFKDYLEKHDKNGKLTGKCFGLLFSNFGNRFSFSGYRDVSNNNFDRFLGKGFNDALIPTIKSLENIFSNRNIKMSITNVLEEYCEEITYKFYSFPDYVKEVGPLNISGYGRNFSCCEQKMLSYINKGLCDNDDVKIFTKFSPCPNCDRALSKYKEKCNSLTAFFLKYINGKYVIDKKVY